MTLLSILQRAFSSNLRRVSVGAGEQASLEAAGIAEPVAQQYLVWRRSILVMVIVLTALTAMLSTARELGAGADEADTFDEIWEALVTAVHGEDEAAPPEATPQPKTAFARFADLVDLAALYAMPIAALGALVFWTRPNLSYRIVLAGWLFGFLMPIAVGLCPWSWWGVDATPAATTLERYRDMAEGVWEGFDYLLALLPTILSLAPGVQRSCLRLKTLLPAAELPGWFLVSLAPFSALLSLVIFVAINQIASNPVLLAGIVVWVAAPLVYVIRSDAFTRPLATAEDLARMQQMQRVVTAMNVTVLAILAGYLLTQQVFGMRLVGLDADTSLLVPLDVVEYFLEFLGRSLFMTALGADVFLRMTLSMWRQAKEFQATSAAEEYDRVMAGLESVVGKAN